jgi:homoserine O-acetyltransferase
MKDIEHGTFRFTGMKLEKGGTLPEVTLAYATRGTLRPDGRNAVLVTHGYTSGHAMIEPGATSSEGAWSDLIGPGAAIETSRDFVVCSNMLGSSFGSTNASFIDPRSGKPYGSTFPRITVQDIVSAQRRLLEHLGVRHLRAVVGPSYGGFQAFQWAVTFPDFMDGIVPVVSSVRPPRGNRAAELEARFARDPNWNGGDYYGRPGAMLGTLRDIRIETLKRYGAEESLASRIPDPAQREATIIRQAEDWARRFDANSLLILARAMDSYEVTSKLKAIRVPVLYVLSRTDVLFPPSLGPEVMAQLRGAGVTAEYCEIDSERGHLASGADAGKWAPVLRRFLAGLE